MDQAHADSWKIENNIFVWIAYIQPNQNRRTKLVWIGLCGETMLCANMI